MTGHLIGGILGLWRSAAAYAGDRRRRMAALREIDALDPHERGRVLGEAGLTRRDLGDTMQAPFASQDLLARALCALDIDAEAFRAGRERDMQRVCMACHARGRCRRDLATGDFARRYRHYCLNADSLSGIEAAAARPHGQA